MASGSLITLHAPHILSQREIWRSPSLTLRFSPSRRCERGCLVPAPENLRPQALPAARGSPMGQGWSRAGGPPPHPPKIPKPKHRFHRILTSAFLGVMDKPQAFTAAGRGLSCSPPFAASDGSEFGVTHRADSPPRGAKAGGNHLSLPAADRCNHVGEAQAAPRRAGWPPLISENERERSRIAAKVEATASGALGCLGTQRPRGEAKLLDPRRLPAGWWCRRGGSPW